MYFRSALLSVVSHSLSAYITTLESVPLQRLSSRDQMEIKKELPRVWATVWLVRDDGGACDERARQCG